MKGVLSLLCVAACAHTGLSQTNSFPLFSSGTYSGGSGDVTNITNAQLKLEATSGYVRVPHLSESATVSTVYNYQTGKHVYWGEPGDAGQYIFRGRNVVVENSSVGLGISSPSQRLDALGRVKFRSASGVSAGAWFTDQGGTEGAFIGKIDDSSNGPLGIYHGGAWRVSVSESGNVGLGTTSPSVWFQGAGVLEMVQTRPVVKLTSTGSISTMVFTSSSVNSTSHYGEFHLNHEFNASDPASSKLNFYAYPTGYALSLAANGNLGVGTNSPSTRLDVVGKGKFSDNLKIFSSSENWAEGLTIIKPTGWSGIRFTRNDPATNNYEGNWAIGYNGATGNDFSISTSHSGSQYDGLFHISNSTRNVGIGTTTPTSKLEVAGSGGGNIDFRVNGRMQVGDSNGAGGIWLSDANNMFVGQAGANVGFWTAGAGWNAFQVTQAGNVGIGTTTPELALHVKRSNDAGIYLDLTGGSKYYMASQPGNYFQIGLSGGGVTQSFVLKNGDVGIGTTTPDAKLSVKGQVHAQEVKVDLNGAVAPDYVFDKDYKLPSLEEIKLYIEMNNHLPEVPSAKEMEVNGMNVGEMNLVLLKKVEELTLYLIEQQKQIKELQSAVTSPKN